MSQFFALACHRLSAFISNERTLVSTASDAGDPYERQRSLRLAQLEAAGKCLARSGKHGNLRYWPAERGSRVLSEHRRRHRSLRSVSHVA
ncbi:MAG: hypothetical protein M3Z31_03325 [Pseudomonadota bacterium]|nr:hypothetical protein [Pseudomonadota bacterium]